MKVIEANLETVKNHPEFISNLKKALDIMEKEQQARLPLDEDVDLKIYDGFWLDGDLGDLLKVREAEIDELSSLVSKVSNSRIRDMIPLYKARNFPQSLSPEELEAWEERKKSVFSASKLERFSNRMKELSSSRKDKNSQYLLTELQLYVESILPEPEF